MSPLRSVGVFAIIAASALVVGGVIPALIAFKSGTFFRDTLKSRLRTSFFPESFNRLQEFDKQKEDLENKIRQIDSCLINPSNNDARNDRSTLLSLRSIYKKELTEKSAPITILPLYPHIIIYVYPIMYTCLGSLVFLLKPRYGELCPPAFSLTRGWSIALATVVLFLFNTWPVWIRNCVFTTPAEGRVVFAYTNIDIDRSSFLMQQVNMLVFSALLAVIWETWSRFFLDLRSHLSDIENSLEDPFNCKELERVSCLLLYWQASFAVLSIGFIMYASLFWDLILRDKDMRFLFEAITVNVIWAVTALLIGLPFLIAWNRWELQKQRAIAKLIAGKSDGSGDLQARLSAVQDMRPFGAWHVAASGVTVISSFALPIVQALLK